MSENESAGNQTPKQYDFTTELINRLTSMKFALGTLLIIALACIAGTLFPQGQEVGQYLQKHPEGVQKMEMLGTLGLTNVFYAWWFIGLLSILAANLTFCVVRRLSVLKTAKGAARTRAIGTMLIHLSMLVIFAGGVIRGIWSEKGSISFRAGESVDAFITPTGPQNIPFTVKLVKFEVERYPAKKTDPDADQDGLVEKLDIHWPEKKLHVSLPAESDSEQVVFSGEGPSIDTNETFRVTVVRRVLDFAIDLNTREVSSKSDEMNNPAIQVRVVGPNIDTKKWLFGRYPDYDMHSGGTNSAGIVPFKMLYNITMQHVERPRIKSFKSSLQIIEGGTVTREKTIEVNSPLSYGGYSFFQTGYNENDPTWTALQVVRDPSVWVVYVGFTLMIIGLLITTYRGMTAQVKQS